MGNVRKAIGLIVCGVMLAAGHSTGQAEPWWQSYLPAPPNNSASNRTSAYQKRGAQQSQQALQARQTRQTQQTQQTQQAESPKKWDAKRGSFTARPSTVPVRRPPETMQPTPLDLYERRLSEAQTQERAGHKALAQTIYHLLIVEYPSRPEAYHRLGQMAAREGQYQEAEGLHAQSLVLDRGNVETLNDLGYCLYCQGKLKQAEKVLQQAVALHSSERQLHANLAAVYGHQGRAVEALEQFRMAGSEAEACTNLAEILVARNDRHAARNYLLQALAADPDHARARQVLDALAEPGSPPAGGTASMATHVTPSATVTR